MKILREDLLRSVHGGGYGVTVTETEFPDSSLGYPMAGFSYAQVITPGYIIDINLPGVDSRIHVDYNGHYVVIK